MFNYVAIFFLALYRTTSGLPHPPASPLHHVSGQDESLRGYSQTLVIDNPYHDSGVWGNVELCENGSFAFAIEVMYQAPGHIDETAINGIKLYCTRPDGTDTGYVTSSVGTHGEWYGMQICSSDNWMTGFRANVLEYQGPFTDDVAVENIQVYCNYEEEVVDGLPIHVPKKPEARDFQPGVWSSWANCDSGSAVCGIQTRYEDFSTGDEVSIADIKLFCCIL